MCHNYAQGNASLCKTNKCQDCINNLTILTLPRRFPWTCSDIRGAFSVIEKVDVALAQFPTFAAESAVPAEEVQFIMRCIEEKRAGSSLALEASSKPTERGTRLELRPMQAPVQ